MTVFSGERSSGKTKKMLQSMQPGDYIVCARPERMREKANAYGVDDIRVIGFDELDEIPDNVNVYIDEVESFLNYVMVGLNVKGFTVITKGE